MRLCHPVLAAAYPKGGPEQKSRPYPKRTFTPLRTARLKPCFLFHHQDL